MTQVLDISEAVVTEHVLRARHAGEPGVRVAPGAIVTPSGWDFLRLHRVHLTRGAVGPTSRQEVPASTPAARVISEVLPPGSEAGVLSRGRCDHPDRPYGCRTEEFGSGFAEPSTCSACAVQQGGANRATDTDEATENLVQTLTNEIMRRLEHS